MNLSVFPLRLPCAVFKVRSRLPQLFELSQLRACGIRFAAVLAPSSAFRPPSCSPRVRLRSLGFRLKVLHFFRSFKTIQYFDQVPNQIPWFFRTFTASAASLWYLYHSPSFAFAPDARPRIRSPLWQPALPRKEVIQPHLPIRLPCYDFTPVIGLTFDGCALSVHSPASGAPNSHGVTGGVYKARERIHRGMLIRDY